MHFSVHTAAAACLVKCFAVSSDDERIKLSSAGNATKDPGAADNRKVSKLVALSEQPPIAKMLDREQIGNILYFMDESEIIHQDIFFLHELML